ncbi:MAG TPA: cytochrome c [Myxococcales bacterium]|nr:cytochrome c [Myxococcales bacterium]
MIDERIVCALILLACAAGASAQDARRGAYLAKAADCIGCHTEEKPGSTPFAGGSALATPFGTFYGSNITPDVKNGIGRWTEADFFRAMHEGRRPDGWPYYPAFPYPSFTKITDDDLRDLWAYLRSLPPSARANHPHELRFPFGFRFLLFGWKWLFFKPGRFVGAPGATQVLDRGAYLVQALGHCGECHTPRNFFGAPKKDRSLAGGMGPDGKNVPNLTPTRLGKMSDEDLKGFLTSGTYPDGDQAAEAMAVVIRNTTSQLTPQDLDALIAYLRSLRPLPEEPKKK